MATRRSNARREFEQTWRAALARLLPQARDTEIIAISEALRGPRGYAGTIGQAGPAGGGGAPDKGCRVYNSAGISIPSTTNTVLTFDSERWDTDAMHDPAVNPGRITIKTAGRYHITGTFYYLDAALGSREIVIKLNNGVFIAGHGHDAPYVPEHTITIDTIYTFALNDYIEFVAYQTSGIAQTMGAIPNQSPEVAAQLLAAT